MNVTPDVPSHFAILKMANLAIILLIGHSPLAFIPIFLSLSQVGVYS